ncbi:PDR/VanB family oxidoreductase [Nocardioides sp. ChNu-99]|uniref:PDR/VanB family oxidoreductase n=1 Tax=Nocardioides sp. ChNu-99 TaxID=2839897 RepID=UPI0024050A96|nr:PDR/VanB family oxidoreductase [Nocardioides sp. ChNu-99]MDF9717904.1 PDR/VanB family oxidoreductase [Nocardioides sp. ChNu-99]
MSATAPTALRAATPPTALPAPGLPAPLGAGERLALVVVAVDDSVPGVRSLSLARPDGGALPSWTPGSHVVVEVPPGAGRERRLANAYSLTGETVHPSAYTVSVLRRDPEEGAAGGSAWVHGLAVGDTVTTTAPRSAFPPVQGATRHLLVGAGIGITPLVSHLRSALRWGRDVQLVQVCRGGRGAHLDEVRALGGDRVTVLDGRAALAAHLPALLGDQPIGTHLYTCGPADFMDAVLAAARALGWPESRLHLEHFGLAALDPGDPFTVTVTGGPTLEVPSGTSLLEALEQQGYDVPHLCRQGVCGECRLRVAPAASTGVHHRDLYLDDAARAAGDCVMACVSRALPDPATGRAHLEVSP